MSPDKKERDLQKRILEEPSLLPGFDEPLSVAEEVPVRRAGKADVVVVDAEGQIGIVECKRATNPESRRWVIGQVFEYAAGLWKLGYEDFTRLLARRGTELTKPFQDDAGWDEEAFRDAVSKTLEAGDFRLFIAVDEMTERLEKKLLRAVVFLNNQLPQKVELLAVTVPQDGSVEVFGNETPEEVPPLSPRFKPDRWAVIDEISSPAAELVAEDLLDWAEREPKVKVNYSEEAGVVEARVYVDGTTLFRIKNHRDVRVSVKRLEARGGPGEEERSRKLLADIDPRFEAGANPPIAPIDSLADDRTRAKFLALMERHLQVLTG